METTVTYSVSDKIATLTLNRPKVMNSFDLQMHEDFYNCLVRANEDEEITAIIINANGKGFSAGADLSVVHQASGESLDIGEYLRKTYNRTVLYMSEIEKPVIASIHGAAFGAGLGIALACDFRIASEDSSFCLAFIKVGLMPDAGTHFYLPRIIGLSRALELAALGDTIGVETASQYGLINRVVKKEELETETDQFAKRVAGLPTKAFGKMKRTMNASFEHTLAESLEAEADGQGELGKTEDHREGVSAFFERRKPAFTGR
ncbi:enoyl-CoA hydratase/isomerase family protein [Pseudalkalibacillus caeni]|uniref:2-(1,2-epoxy-1,2-dihydrophenyl)acetyl-CoA isomerase n=1 Tax=Exobacillus caeni TaxID=2574798 RepID=A0A5R9F3N0_9BACL|nr:enoyl-CoA hydratase-related protein [Pseudalkalibacillus caeni]TLS38292.1 2-(1,2-epoxy-1,2-dihydrophenyl)acetyl-CoA isomerase [Pseudalkalibacillus caeni]